MHRLLTIAVLSLLPLLAVSKKKIIHKPVAKSSANKPSSSRQVASRRSLVKSSSSKKRRAVASAPAGPRMQSAPSADRYKEIQEALIAKGYMKTPATGAWDEDSQEAMRKFQADQSLDVTGKLSARTLISLGLGPKP